MPKHLLLAGILASAVAAPAAASLNLFQQYVGSYGLSSDGSGSLNGDNNIRAFVPTGATVTAAYLYQANIIGAGPTNQPVSLNTNPLTFSPNVLNPNGASSSRADVTSILAPIINGGPGGTYNFTVNEGNTFATDGTALVVVYSLPSLPTSTIAILDGFSAVGGDTASLNFATALDPTAPGFSAEMRLGDNYSCCGQASTVVVNGTTITNNAGNNDDGLVVANGSLITVGGNNDPFSPLLPTYDADHERYNLVPYIHTGDSAINIRTNNPSGDDNIFLALFAVSGRGNVVTNGGNALPEPSTWAMMLLGFGAVGVAMRRKKVSARVAQQISA